MRNNLLNKVLSVVVLSAFLFNDLCFGLGVQPGTTQAPTKDAMYALGQKLFAAKVGPGAVNFDQYTGEFRGVAPDLPGLKFVPADYNKLPKGWESNPVLAQTDLIKALTNFRDIAHIFHGDLDIREGYFPVDEVAGELPIARIEKESGKYVLVVHTKFVQMWNHIRENDIWFDYTFPDGKTRTISVAWGLFYRLAKHEMTDLERATNRPKSLGHLSTIWGLGGVELMDNEVLASLIGGRYNIINDGIWLWFLSSYCFANSTRYDNRTMAERMVWLIEGKDYNVVSMGRKEFPNLVKSHKANNKDKSLAYSIALSVNYHFFSRPGVKIPELKTESIFIGEYEQRQAAREEAGITEPHLYATGTEGERPALVVYDKRAGALKITLRGGIADGVHAIIYSNINRAIIHEREGGEKLHRSDPRWVRAAELIREVVGRERSDAKKRQQKPAGAADLPAITAQMIADIEKESGTKHAPGSKPIINEDEVLSILSVPLDKDEESPVDSAPDAQDNSKDIPLSSESPVAEVLREGVYLQDLAQHKLVNALLSMFINSSTEDKTDFWHEQKIDHARIIWIGEKYVKNSSFKDIFDKLVWAEAIRNGKKSPDFKDQISVAARMVNLAGLRRKIKVDSNFVRRLKQGLENQIEHFSVYKYGGTIYAMRKYVALAAQIRSHVKVERFLHLEAILRTFDGYPNRFDRYAQYEKWRRHPNSKREVRTGGRLIEGWMSYNEFAQLAHNFAERVYPVSGVISRARIDIQGSEVPVAAVRPSAGKEVVISASEIAKATGIQEKTAAKLIRVINKINPASPVTVEEIVNIMIDKGALIYRGGSTILAFLSLEISPDRWVANDLRMDNAIALILKAKGVYKSPAEIRLQTGFVPDMVARYSPVTLVKFILRSNPAIKDENLALIRNELDRYPKKSREFECLWKKANDILAQKTSAPERAANKRGLSIETLVEVMEGSGTLKTRILNTLEQYGVTAERLVSMDAKEALKMRGFGEKALVALAAACRKFGFENTNFVRSVERMRFKPISPDMAKEKVAKVSAPGFAGSRKRNDKADILKRKIIDALAGVEDITPDWRFDTAYLFLAAENYDLAVKLMGMKRFVGGAGTTNSIKRAIKKATNLNKWQDVLRLAFFEPDPISTPQKKPESSDMTKGKKAVSPDKVKVLFADDPANPDSLEAMCKDFSVRFRGEVEIIKEHGAGKNIEWLLTQIKNHKPAIIVVRSNTKGFKDDKKSAWDSSELFKVAQANGVKAIIRAGAGVDNIDTVKAREHDISVARTHGNANSVADLTLFLLAALDGNIPMIDNGVTFTSLDNIEGVFQTAPAEYIKLLRESKKWGNVPESRRDPFIKGWENNICDPTVPWNVSELIKLARILNGRSIGLLGWGAVAKRLALKLDMIRNLTGAKFSILVYSRSLKPNDRTAMELNVFPVLSRDILFDRSDIVSIHLPGDVKGLELTRDELSSPKLRVLINTARSSLADTKLIEQFVADRNGVYVGDLDMTDELCKLMESYPNNVAIFPHIGASTEDAGRGVEENTVFALSGMINHLLGRGNISQEPLPEIMNGVIPTAIAQTAAKPFSPDMAKKKNRPTPAMLSPLKIFETIVLSDRAWLILLDTGYITLSHIRRSVKDNDLSRNDLVRLQKAGLVMIWDPPRRKSGWDFREQLDGELADVSSIPLSKVGRPYSIELTPKSRLIAKTIRRNAHSKSDRQLRDEAEALRCGVLYELGRAIAEHFKKDDHFHYSAVGEFISKKLKKKIADCYPDEEDLILTAVRDLCMISKGGLFFSIDESGREFKLFDPSILLQLGKGSKASQIMPPNASKPYSPDMAKEKGESAQDALHSGDQAAKLRQMTAQRNGMPLPVESQIKDVIRPEDRLKNPAAIKDDQAAGLRRLIARTQAERSLPEIISEYIIKLGLDKGPGAYKLSNNDLENIYKTVGLLENSQIEIFVPQQLKLTEDMQKAIKEIGKREGKTPVFCRQYSSLQNLAKMLESKSAAKRIVITNITDQRSQDEMIYFVQEYPEFLRFARMLNVATPTNYQNMDNLEKTVYQAKIVTIAILARLFEKDSTPMVESLLRYMVKGCLDVDDKGMETFMSELGRPGDGAGLKRQELVDRILFLLGKTVKLIEKIGQEIQLMKNFWVAA